MHSTMKDMHLPKKSWSIGVEGINNNKIVSLDKYMEVTSLQSKGMAQYIVL